jgi:DNA-binding transcriptional regulator GbsR (MarR family)
MDDSARRSAKRVGPAAKKGRGLTKDHDAGKPSAAMQRFVDYFAELGPRWGLRGATARVHAFLYLADGPTAADLVARALQMNDDEVAAALSDLAEWKMAEQISDKWLVGDDPWELLVTGLEERRKREMPEALALMQACVTLAENDGATPGQAKDKMADMLSLIRDLEAIHPSRQMLSSRAVRQIISFGASASRLFKRS